MNLVREKKQHSFKRLLVERLTNKQLSNEPLSNERGVYLPIAAVIAGVLILMVISLVIDTGVAKQVRRGLQFQNDLFCKNAAQELPSMSEALRIFSNNYSALQSNPANFNLKRVNFPVAPGDVKLVAPLNGLDTSTSFLGISSSWPTSLSSSGGFFPAAFHDNWVFDDDVTLQAVRDRYPASFWNHQNSFGSMIGCEISAEAKTFLPRLQPVPVKVTSVWKRRPRTAGARFWIAIAPEMVTWSNLFSGNPTRFEFTEWSAVTGLGVSPFNILQSAEKPFSYDDSNLGSLNAAITDPSALRERQVSCINPATAFRNILASSLVRNLARSSFSREDTEVYLLHSMGLLNGAKLPNTGSFTFIGQGDIAQKGTAALDDLLLNINVSPAPSDPNAETRAQRALLDCFHAYNSDGIEPALAVDGVQDGVQLLNVRFEDPSLNVFPSSSFTGYPANSYSSLEPWGPDTLGSEVSMSVEQIVSILGTVQANPSNASDGGVAANKEALDTPALLVPDIQQFLVDINASMEAAGQGAGELVIITHQPLEQIPAGNWDTAFDLAVAALNARGVLVTILYLPTRYADWQNPNHARILNVGSGNSFFMFPPDNDPAMSAAADQTAQDIALRDYWYAKLTPGAAANAEAISRNIWNLLTVVEVGL